MFIKSKHVVPSAWMLAVLLFASCGKKSESNDLGMIATLAALAAPKADAIMPVALTFQTADDNTSTAADAFACAGTMTVATRTLAPKDLRFFVSELKLVKADLTTVDVTLNQDGVWQYQNAALLDFENATGTCNPTTSGGTTATNKTVMGTAPAGNYIGIQFTLGLPQALNQLDNATSPSPMNTTSMYWSWTGGFKFMKFEYADGAASNSFHPGSTGCSTYTAGGTVGAQNCAKPYRGQILVTNPAGFDPATQRIALNLTSMLAGYNTAAGGMMGMCMPGDANMNCQNILANLGFNNTWDGTSTLGANSFEIR